MPSLTPSSTSSGNSSSNTKLSRKRGTKSSYSSIIFYNPATIVSHLLVGIVCFHLGLSARRGGGNAVNNEAAAAAEAATRIPPPVQRQDQEIKQCPPCPKQQAEEPPPEQARNNAAQQQEQQQDRNPASPIHFGSPFSRILRGAVRVSRNDFLKHVVKDQIGVPMDVTSPGNENVLLLYTHTNTLPRWSVNVTTDDSDVPLYPAVDATKNCHSLKVILQKVGDNDHTCIAIMGQYESFHIQKLMRIKRGSVEKIVPSEPLQYVARTHQASGRQTTFTTTQATEDYFLRIFLDYVQKLKTTRQRLSPLARIVAAGTNAMIVMVCNFGQSSLLMNFVCAARSRNLDTSRILVFATDQATYQLADQVLQLHVFDVQDAFGDMPRHAARTYGDAAFTGMMLAKVYCVHLINTLGYDLLFQDVDVIWKRNPLDYFTNTSKSGDFDVYFQDDGARSTRYTPYSPNTGFYFVRNTPRSVYFMNVFVRMGDLIRTSGSHQSSLTAVLSEHASWRGLRIKVFGKDDVDENYFPGGFHYHKRKEYMKSWFAGTATPSPYIFHMSWTKNKDNKRLFFQQMGEWYVQPTCEDKTMDALGSSSISQCCSAEPLITCHYKDKPSKIPCRDSPPIDRGHPSWW